MRRSMTQRSVPIAFFSALLLQPLLLAASPALQSLTSSDITLMPLGLADLAWQDDPSALAQSPAWDFRAGYFMRSKPVREPDAQDRLTSVGQASVSRGLADAGGFGALVGQETVQVGSALQTDLSAKALGLGYGWAMGSGFTGGLSLWQATTTQAGQDDLSQALAGAGARWTGSGQWSYVSGLWSKDGSVRPLNLGLGGTLARRWNWAATARVEAEGMTDSVLLLGWGPLRVYHRSQQLGGFGIDYRLEGPTWSLRWDLDVDPYDPLKLRVAYDWHGWWLEHVPGASSNHYALGWHSWSAPPPPAAAGAPGENAAPAVPDVDPAPAPPPLGRSKGEHDAH